MIIANPIYDVVFKRMMENERVAKFFVGTLLDQNIEAIEVKPQEYTYEGEFDFSNPKDVEKYDNRIRERFTIWVYRLDFIATIRTESGELKKVLIEIQKARNLIDLMRFRNYLAEQYKKEDIVDGQKVILPITTIYILGFKLPEIDTPCLKVERSYRNLIDKNILKTKSDFVEKLTHDSYIVQVERITDRYQTKLDKLLSVFEQTNFADDRKITKEFVHSADIEEIKIMTDILHYSGTNLSERKEIENEQEAWRTVNAMLESQEEKYMKVIERNQKMLDERTKALDDSKKALEEKRAALNDSAKALEERRVALENNKKELDEKNNELDEAKRILDSKDQLIADLLKKLNP